MLARIFFISCFLLCQTIIINAEPIADWLLALADVADSILNLLDRKLALKEQTFKSGRELIETLIFGIPQPPSNERSGPGVRLNLPEITSGEEKGLRKYSVAARKLESDIKSPGLSRIAAALKPQRISNLPQEES